MRDSCLRSASLSETLSVVFLLASLVTAPPVSAADGEGGTAPAADAVPDAGAGANGALATITITAQRLNKVRQEIETRTGASTYTITSDAIAATPGGENVQMN